jgi:HAD superfamily hydrolase (TIGR01549 family)
VRLRAVLFDMDGTVVDVPYDWEKIRRDLDTGGKPILHFISGLSEPERTRKQKILEDYEARATAEARLKDGIETFLGFLSKKGVKTALVTNNSLKNTAVILERFRLRFDCVLSRDSGLWKPSGAPLLAALKSLGVMREESCVVGDSRFDVLAARDAGIKTIFIIDGDGKDFSSLDVEAFPGYPELIKRFDSMVE